LDASLRVNSSHRFCLRIEPEPSFAKNKHQANLTMYPLQNSIKRFWHRWLQTSDAISVRQGIKNQIIRRLKNFNTPEIAKQFIRF